MQERDDIHSTEDGPSSSAVPSSAAKHNRMRTSLKKRETATSGDDKKKEKKKKVVDDPPVDSGAELARLMEENAALLAELRTSGTATAEMTARAKDISTLIAEAKLAKEERAKVFVIIYHKKAIPS